MYRGGYHDSTIQGAWHPTAGQTDGAKLPVFDERYCLGSICGILSAKSFLSGATAGYGAPTWAE